MDTVEIKQLLAYAPIAEGGQKLASLSKDGVVMIYDDSENEWIGTNTVIKGVKTKTPDEKVLDYLERAEQILISAEFGVWEFGKGHIPAKRDVLEIAKMIQLEELK